MIYIGDDKLDLSDLELVRFMRSANSGDTWAPESPIVDDYVESQINPIPLGSMPSPREGFGVHWIDIETWGIYARAGSGGQKVAQTDIRILYRMKVNIHASVSLYLQTGLPVEIQAAIEAVFSAYNYPSSGDVDTYIAKAVAQDSRLNLAMIALCKRLTVSANGNAAPDYRERDNLARWIQEATVNSEDYRLLLVSRKALDGASYPSPLPGRTELGDPQAAAESAAAADQEAGRCAGFETKTREITRIDWAPDTRWKWGWHLVKVGCVSFSLYYPEIQVRDNELVAMVWVTIPEGFRPVESAIRKCAEDSALASAVYFILFSDLPGALVAFRALFVECLKRKFNEAIACANAGIVVDTRAIGDWH